MMRRYILILLPLLAAVLNASAARPSSVPFFKYGLEWGTTGTLYTTMHQNYTAEEGYRVDDNRDYWTYISNAFFLANIGFNITERLSLGVYSGYSGISTENRIIPLTGRASFYPKGIASDGMVCFLDGGVGFKDIKNPSAVCMLGSLGSGYHLALSRSVSIDFLANLRYALDHPEIIDPDSGKAVPSGHIRRNNASYCSINFSIAINF